MTVHESSKHIRMCVYMDGMMCCFSTIMLIVSDIFSHVCVCMLVTFPQSGHNESVWLCMYVCISSSLSLRFVCIISFFVHISLPVWCDIAIRSCTVHRKLNKYSHTIGFCFFMCAGVYDICVKYRSNSSFFPFNKKNTIFVGKKNRTENSAKFMENNFNRDSVQTNTVDFDTAINLIHF